MSFAPKVIQVPGQEVSIAQTSSFAPVVNAALDKVAQSPHLELFEKLFRVVPDDAWYSAVRSPSNPTQFEIGTHNVPNARAIIITSFSFAPYKFSGTGAYAFEPLAPGELNGVVGYRFDVSSRVPGSVDYELNPAPSFGRRRKFAGDPTTLIAPGQRTAQDFARVQANSFGSATGYGTGILPQRWGRFGDVTHPWAYKANMKEQITLTGLVLRPVPIPLACIEGLVQGYIGAQDVVDKMFADLKAQG